MKLFVFVAMMLCQVVNAGMMVGEPLPWLASNYTQFEYEGLHKHTDILTRLVVSNPQLNVLGVYPNKDNICTWWADKNTFGEVNTSLADISWLPINHDLAEYNTADKIRIVVEDLVFDENANIWTQSFSYYVEWSGITSVNFDRTYHLTTFYENNLLPELNTGLLVLIVLLVLFSIPKRR